MTSALKRPVVRVTGASVGVVVVLLAVLEGVRIVGASPAFEWSDPLVLGFGAVALGFFAVVWVLTHPAFEE